MVAIKNKLSDKVLDLFEKDNTKQLTDTIEQKIIDDLIIQYDKHILNRTENALKLLGFKFDSDKELIDFCINRVQKINYENKNNYFELYLDYKSNNEKGTLILFGNESIEIDAIENGKVSYTIG
jgi:hypothetical protein